MRKRIFNYINKKYLCTVSCCSNNEPWANAFYYVFDEEQQRLIYVTGIQTHHAQVMLKNPNVAGTIFAPTRLHALLQGIQFLGQAQLLTGEDAEIARNLYKRDYAHELIDQLSMWAIRLDYVRMIDNSLGLFSTIEWRRGEPIDDCDQNEYEYENLFER